LLIAGARPPRDDGHKGGTTAKVLSRNGGLKLRDPHKPLMRAFLRTPLLLYRTPLRAMLAPFYVQIEHQGRKSGRVYRTVVDRLHTDRETGEVFVTSAWGHKSDWFRNIQAAPSSGVWIGRRRFEPTQRIVESEEAYEIHRKAKEERPLAIRFGLALVRYPFPKTEEDLRELTRFMPVVGFRPSEAPGRDDAT
jgi:deazaflavin-dependent oxidoreductase (nitroreductase family)